MVQYPKTIIFVFGTLPSQPSSCTPLMPGHKRLTPPTPYLRPSPSCTPYEESIRGMPYALITHCMTQCYFKQNCKHVGGSNNGEKGLVVVANTK